MPADYPSIDQKSDDVSLDSAPDHPEPLRKGRSGLGEMASSPALLALQGLQNIENGMQAIVAAVPQLGQLTGQLGILLTQLRQAVPQALTGGPRGPFQPSGILTPPGMMPGGGAPPGMGAQGGAPNAPSPIPPGMG